MGGVCVGCLLAWSSRTADYQLRAYTAERLRRPARLGDGPMADPTDPFGPGSLATNMEGLHHPPLTLPRPRVDSDTPPQDPAGYSAGGSSGSPSLPPTTVQAAALPPAVAAAMGLKLPGHGPGQLAMRQAYRRFVEIADQVIGAVADVYLVCPGPSAGGGG